MKIIPFFKDNRNVKLLFYIYYGISVIICLAYFLTSFWSAELVTFLGNQSLILPTFGLLMADEIGSMLLGRFFVYYWFGSILLFVVCFIVTVWKKNFTLFSIIVLLDGIFTIAFTVANILHSGFTTLHLILFLGAILDLFLAYSIATVCGKKSVQ